jgi:hypothetical protein
MTQLAIQPSNLPQDDQDDARLDLLNSADALRWQIGQDFHEQLMEDIYTNAAQLADRAVTRPDEQPRFDLDRTIDRIVTSRLWGFPLMILLVHPRLLDHHLRRQRSLRHGSPPSSSTGCIRCSSTGRRRSTCRGGWTVFSSTACI